MRRVGKAGFADILLPLATSIITAVFVGILSNILFTGEKFFVALGRLGLWNLLLPLWLILVVLSVTRTRKSRKDVDVAVADIRARFSELLLYTVNHLLELSAEAFVYSSKSARLNIHLFFRGEVEGKEALIKDRRFFFEQEKLPGNYSMDCAFPAEDELVICNSFNRDNLIYQELPATHVTKYNERIVDRVDPAVAWVLACPLHVQGRKPLGVICCFGSKLLFSDVAERNAFESVILQISEVIVQLKEFEAAGSAA